MVLDIDVPGTVSANLITVIETEVNNPDAVQPSTLGSVLDAMNQGLVARLIATGRIEADEDAMVDETKALMEEIKALIENHGADRLAQDFMCYRAGEDLAVVIRAELDNQESDQPPTLGSVLESMNRGLVADLVSTGDIDPDEDETLLAEIQQLIKKHGEDAPAEDFLP